MNVLESFKLNNKVAIVTGGYGNLGSAFTDALLEAGAVVIVAGRRYEEFENKYRNTSNVFFEPINIMNSESVSRCFEDIYYRHKSIDILVNNATTVKGQFFELITDDEFNYSMEGVIGSVFKCCREVVKYMKLSGGGNIINISSMYGVVVPDFRLYEGDCSWQFNPIHYGAGKAAVIQMSKYLAEYLHKYKIRVNCICPGTFPSKQTQKDVEFMGRLASKNPMGKIGDPEDLKGALIYLASDASQYVTGQNLQVDGGWTIW